MREHLLERDLFLSQLRLVDIQWFASDDEGRTEEATEHKLKKKAREEGNVAKSPDLSSVIVLIVAIVTLAITGPSFMETAMDMIRYYFGQASSFDPAKDSGLQLAFIEYFIKLALPIMAVGFIAGALGNIIQVGFLFTTKPLKPDFKKIVPNFSQYFKKTIGSVEAFYTLAKSFIKVGVVIGISYANIEASMPRLLRLADQTFLQSFNFVAWLTFAVVIECAIVLLFMAAFDYWFMRRQHREALKMTPQEVKQERKDYDGDPMVKSRLKQRMREILTQNMIKNIPRADVVVTNPTHFAVALEYKQGEMEAPLVLAKGADEIAFKIREIAKEHNIPIIENKPLARALFAEVDIGNAIPPRFYEAVVVVLKQVYRLRRKRPVEKEAV